MKNQYTADIGDYGKYSLLRHFEDAGVSIGINWYLTEDDHSNDGKFISYLSDNKMRQYDPKVYDVLRDLLKNSNRSVAGVEKSRLFTNTTYFNELMDFSDSPTEIVNLRYKWHKRAIDSLEKAELIFLDPDNGLNTRGESTSRNSEKYVIPSEVYDYYRNAHNVVFYCHKGRRTKEQWEEYKRFMHNMIPYSKSFGVTYHKGSQRSYIFLVHPKSYEKYQDIIRTVLEDWQGIFTYEDIDTRSRLEGVYIEIQKYLDESEPIYYKLYDYLKENGMIVNNYYKYLSTDPMAVDVELKRLNLLDIEECSALLTMLYREDHFSPGAFEERQRKGEVQIVLKKLMKLISNDLL